MTPSIENVRDQVPPNPLANMPPLPDCPKCGNAKLVQLLKSMRRHDRANDWFRCDKCGQLYTRARMDGEKRPPQARNTDHDV
jgi:DNA-directed RNA polymerase subunit M/transcription elongation factor TFIIS